MRPSFRIEVACARDDLLRTLRARLDADRVSVVGTVASRQCTLEIPAEGRRVWTPCLDMILDDVGDESEACTRVWGTFSPRAEIWTAFVFAIGGLVIMSVFSSVYGIAQLALGRTPGALFVPLVSIVLAALLYLAALVGQGLSIAEMYRLRAFLDDCLRDTEESSPKRSTAADADRESLVPHLP